VLGSLGFTEIAFILVLALLLFGPKRLPEIGRTLGKGLAEFRRASNELKRSLESEVALEESSTRRPSTPLTQAQPRPSIAAPAVAESAAGASDGGLVDETASAESAAMQAPSAGEDAPSSSVASPSGDPDRVTH